MPEQLDFHSVPDREYHDSAPSSFLKSRGSRALCVTVHQRVFVRMLQRKVVHLRMLSVWSLSVFPPLMFGFVKPSTNPLTAEVLIIISTTDADVSSGKTHG